ncbi:hypothetical protein ACIA8K_29815 [Catenuloplanes sp. NPDC051500]|uniref:hypothetical protein n=1 Tax=Catenuloplanes sp. NPDC051500 TaxID=3363959 RepID=UPI0037B547A6
MITSLNRGLWLACCVLLGGLVSVIGGLLDYASGREITQSIITGAAAFAATLTLAILVLSFYRQTDKS